MTFWQIVPKNDGYTYLSRNDYGEHILLKKSGTRRNLGRLTFSSKENTDRYIETNNLSNDYKAEAFMVGSALFKYWQNDYEED